MSNNFEWCGVQKVDWIYPVCSCGQDCCEVQERRLSDADWLEGQMNDLPYKTMDEA